MEALLVKYGYVLLFLGVAVEGEAALLAAALLAHRGLLSLPIVMLVAIAANSLADQAYYFAARSRGRGWLERRFGQSPHYGRLLGLMERHAPWLLMVSRYAYGLRILIPAACGALGMRRRVFVPLDLLASVAWAVPMALVGFYGGLALESALVKLRHYEVLLGLAALVLPAAWLALRRLRRLVRPRDLRWSDLHAVVPFVMGLMGVLNLASGMWPRSSTAVHALEAWLPLEVMQGSRAPMLFAGIALLQVTRNLSHRKALAWWVAVVALGVSFLSHVGRAFDIQHSLVAALLLAYLIVFRRRFNALSDPASLRRGVLMVPVLAGTVLLYAALGFHHMQAQFTWSAGASVLGEAFRAGIAIVDGGLQPRNAHAAHFLQSVQIAGWLARFYTLVLLLRPVVLRSRLQAPDEVVARLFSAHGQKSLAAFAILPDKHHQVLAGGRALVAYATRGSVTLACGDPLAPDDVFELSVKEYLAHCGRHGWTPCIYEAAAERLPVYKGLGLRCLKIAEEAIVDLPSFSLAGGKRAALRSMVHKVQRSGLVVTPYRRALEAAADVDEQLEEISEEWLAEKRVSEMSFTLGRFTLEALDQAHVFLLRSGDRVQAFCSWMPYCDGKAAVLDLMRKRHDSISGAMDLLLTEALLALKAAGLVEASLANAPLANTGEPHTPLDRGVSLLFEHLNAFYGYKNLFQFKKKFAPRWEGRYLVYPRNADLPRVAYAMTALHTSRYDLLGLLFPK
jgi:phosphatidylglycerol lysyltransferase